MCFILSCCFNTATLFCKFNKQNELYLHNVDSSDSVYLPLIGYFLFYLVPLTACWIAAALYSFQSSVYANLLAADSITAVARQLRLYPAMLAVCMFPLSAFFVVVLLTGEEVPWLLFMGAILTSSSGTINAVAYLTIISKPSAYRQRLSAQRRSSADYFRRLGRPPNLEGGLTSSIMIGMDDADDSLEGGEGYAVGSSGISSVSNSSHYVDRLSFVESSCGEGGSSSCVRSVADDIDSVS